MSPHPEVDRQTDQPRIWTFPLTGAVAGVISTIAFAGLHALLIGPIWFFLVAMLVAGASCGLAIAWTFGIITGRPTVRTWVLYNGTFIGLLLLLGILSVAFYEPVTTISALLALAGPPDFLFREVMPLSVGFALGAAAVLAFLFGRRWWHVVPALLTMTLVTFFLGLNISILGLVEIPRSSFYLVALNFGLIVAIVSVYAVAFVALEWRRFRAA